MQMFKHVIRNGQGIYADSADYVVKTAKLFESQMCLAKRSQTGDLKHIFSVAALGVQSGDEVTVTIEGPDEEKAALVMKEVFEQRF